jgi:hypothetical protein
MFIRAPTLYLDIQRQDHQWLVAFSPRARDCQKFSRVSLLRDPDPPETDLSTLNLRLLIVILQFESDITSRGVAGCIKPFFPEVQGQATFMRSAAQTYK